MIHVLHTEWLVNLPLVDIGKFFAALERNWPILFSHEAVHEPDFIFWISPMIIAKKNGLSGDWLLLVFCIQIIWSFSLGCPFQVFFTTCFVVFFFKRGVAKFNLSCFVSCSVSEVDIFKVDILARQSYCGIQFVSSTLSSRCLDFSLIVRR